MREEKSLCKGRTLDVNYWTVSSSIKSGYSLHMEALKSGTRPQRPCTSCTSCIKPSWSAPRRLCFGLWSTVGPVLQSGALIFLSLSCRGNPNPAWRKPPSASHWLTARHFHIPVCSLPSWLQHKQSRLEVVKLTSAVESVFGSPLIGWALSIRSPN